MSPEDLSLAQRYRDHFRRAGIEQLYPPQAAAVEAGVCEGANVVAASSRGGEPGATAGGPS